MRRFATLLLLPSALLLDAGQIDPTCAAQPQEPAVRYARAQIILRRAPTAASDSVVTLQRGAEVTLIGCHEGWCWVRQSMLSGFVPDTMLALTPATDAPAANPADAQGRNCCRVCTTGKACGNGCIARNRTCRQPPGCACNG